MTFLKTELPKKVKLSGADCFHLMLDKHAKHHQSGGNVVRMAFFLDAEISKDVLKIHLKNSATIHWLCNIKLVNKKFKIPYWQYSDSGNEIEIREHYTEKPNYIPESIFTKNIDLNTMRFIEADIIHGPNKKSTILFSWNHILMDGRGSGMLIDQINKPNDSIQLSSFFPKKVKQSGWISSIKNMFEVKHFLEKSSSEKIASVAKNSEQESGEFNFKIIRFNQEETKLIEKNALVNGTRFGVNSFLIATCSIATNSIIKAKGRTGNLWIPVPYDGRLRGAFGPVISNNISSIFYTIPQEKLIDTKTAVSHIVSQMNEQLRLEMPKKYNRLLDMMRYIPSSIYYKLVNRPGEGSLASFLFTATGEGIGDLKTFFDIAVNDVVIYEPQTFPPGLTFLFLRFNNTLKINISYASSIISKTELVTLEIELKAILLQQ